MRAATALAVLAVVTALVGVAGYGLFAGDGGDLTVTWTSETGRDIGANHHAVAVGDGTVYAPISGDDRSGNCALVALSAANGSVGWTHGVPPANCTLHSVADPTVADADGDGDREVLATSTEEAAFVFDADTGAVTRRYELTDYGYTAPVVADLADAPGPETVVVDVSGTAFVLGSDGETLWTHRFGERVWAQPAVADFDGDGDAELLAAGRSGGAVLFEGDGRVRWRSTVAKGDAITWGATGSVEGGHVAVFSTVDGAVVAVDGASGDVAWRRTFGEFAAVRDVGDGDGDGRSEVYVTTRDGAVRALDAATGTEEWSTEVVTERVQMMPPPTLGEVDGDGGAELVVPGNDGSVTLLDATDGSVEGSYARSTPIFTHTTLADTDGDGRAEAYVMYADGRVVRLDYHE